MATNKGYQEILKLVEKFMVKSGIRGYCTTICKGRCCNSCYKSWRACHKTDGRRLACSAFICHELRKATFTVTQEDIYHRLGTNITRSLYRTTRGSYISMYFVPISKKVQGAFEMNPASIIQLMKYTDRIYDKVLVLTHLITHTCKLK